MFGIRLTSLFKSRWTALLWAGMVVFTAVRFVGFAPSGDDGDGAAPESSQTLSNDDAAAVRRLVDGQ